MSKLKLFAFILVLAAGTSMAKAEIITGSCGEDLTWSLNTEDSTLVIEGTGAMDFGGEGKSAPWSKHKKGIKSVSLPDGLTTIGYTAFMDTHITSVTIPNSVTSIADFAFVKDSLLTSITWGDGV